MGRFKIWKEGIDSKEGDILLRLLPCRDKKDCGVHLCAVNKSGDKVERGNLLSFHNENAFDFNEGVNEEIGFKLDEDGKIIPGEPLNEYNLEKKEDQFIRAMKILTIDKKISELKEELKEELKKIVSS